MEALLCNRVAVAAPATMLPPERPFGHGGLSISRRWRCGSAFAAGLAEPEKRGCFGRGLHGPLSPSTGPQRLFGVAGRKLGRRRAAPFPRPRPQMPCGPRDLRPKLRDAAPLSCRPSDRSALAGFADRPDVRVLPDPPSQTETEAPPWTDRPIRSLIARPVSASLSGRGLRPSAGSTGTCPPRPGPKPQDRTATGPFRPLSGDCAPSMEGASARSAEPARSLIHRRQGLLWTMGAQAEDAASLPVEEVDFRPGLPRNPADPEPVESAA